MVPELPKRGVKRLLGLCPSFTADCLETLEEMGIRGRDDFLKAGGEHYTLVPCVNSDPGWVSGVVGLVRCSSAGAGGTTAARPFDGHGWRR